MRTLKIQRGITTALTGVLGIALLASCKQIESLKYDGRFRAKAENVESFKTSKEAGDACRSAWDALEKIAGKEEDQYYCRYEIWINTFGLYERGTKRLITDFTYEERS